MVLAVEQKRQRRLECFGDFEIVQLEVQRRRHQAHHRRNRKTCPGQVLRQPAKNFHLGRIQPDFFFGFAQGGGFSRGIGWLATSAGKADLAAMVTQMRGTLGEQHGRPRFAQDNGHQDCGRYV